MWVWNSIYITYFYIFNSKVYRTITNNVWVPKLLSRPNILLSCDSKDNVYAKKKLRRCKGEIIYSYNRKFQYKDSNKWKFQKNKNVKNLNAKEKTRLTPQDMHSYLTIRPSDHALPRPNALCTWRKKRDSKNEYKIIPVRPPTCRLSSHPKLNGQHGFLVGSRTSSSNLRPLGVFPWEFYYSQSSRLVPRGSLC